MEETNEYGGHSLIIPLNFLFYFHFIGTNDIDGYINVVALTCTMVFYIITDNESNDSTGNSNYYYKCKNRFHISNFFVTLQM